MNLIEPEEKGLEIGLAISSLKGGKDWIWIMFFSWTFRGSSQTQTHHILENSNMNQSI